MGKNGNSERLYFGGLQNHCRWWIYPWDSKILASWKKSHEQPRQHIKKRRHYSADKGSSSQSYGFSSSLVMMWELDSKESWPLENWCFWTVGEDSWGYLGPKDIQPVHPKGNQSWIFTGRTDAEAETPILWILNVKNWPIGKDPEAVKDWRQEEKGTIEDEMIGWHHRLNAHEFEQAPGVGDGQGNLACCSPWGFKESDTTEQLSWTEHRVFIGAQFLAATSFAALWHSQFGTLLCQIQHVRDSSNKMEVTSSCNLNTEVISHHFLWIPFVTFEKRLLHYMVNRRRWESLETNL